jgi:hypothetical protein
MTIAELIQKIIGKLTYNQMYVPDYPDEDRTSLDRENERLRLWFGEVIGMVRREDVGDWLRMGQSSMEEAFKKLQGGDEERGIRDIEFSIQYLRNALAKKPHKADFISQLGGPLTKAESDADEVGS